jgi:branched-chain amino acid transport system ATP-binding protein
VTESTAVAFPVLEVVNVTKAFQGLVALSDVSFSVEKSLIFGVIGPNGAGKTTLFNIVTNIYLPTVGTIRFEGKEITGLPAYAIARRGVARTFQSVRLFADQSVIENVLIGTYRHTKAGLIGGILRSASAVAEQRRAREEAMGCLEYVGLDGLAERSAEGLPFGQQRLLELARALALRPVLLLLDEPAAGLNDRETEQLGQLIKALPKREITVVLVEHNMDLMMSVADRMLVLNYGTKITEGTPHEVQSDRRVIQAYLGEDEE